jgi:hypothetical protein
MWHNCRKGHILCRRSHECSKGWWYTKTPTRMSDNPKFKAFVESVFPLSCPGIEPNFLFFDNACGLRSHLEGCEAVPLLKRLAIVVDAFHYPGHIETHRGCKEFCSSEAYPLLKCPDGSFLFNSSAAEQINAWFGKFQPKVKEMNVTR